MPEDVANLTVKVGMEAGSFDKGAADLARELRVVQSEIKLTGTDAEDMGRRVEVLGKQVTIQQQLVDLWAGKLEKAREKLAKTTAAQGDVITKVDAARKAYEDSAASTGKSSDQTRTLKEAYDALSKELDKASEKVRLNSKDVDKAQESYNNANVYLNKHKEALDEAGGASSNFGGKIVELTEIVGIQLPDGLKTSIEGVDNFKAGLVAVVGMATAMVTALVKMSVEASKTADELLEMSDKTGLTVQRLQELKYAAPLVDVELSTMTGSVTKLIRSMSDARDGGKETQKAFSTLGLSIKESNGSLRDANTVFLEAIDALGRVGNETERDALAMEIFGKSARELNPLIKAGSEGLNELAQEAHAMGYVMSDQAVDDLGALNDGLERLAAQGEAVKNSLAMALLPILTAILELVSKIPAPMLAIITVVISLVAMIIALVSAIKSVTDTTNTIKDFFKSGINDPATKTTLIVLGVVAALIALAAIIAVIMGKSGELKSTLGEIGGSMSSMTNNIPQLKNIPAAATGTSYHRGGAILVGEEGPEIAELPQGTRVYPHKRSMAMMEGSEGDQNVTINVNAANLQSMVDVVNVLDRVKQYKRARRTGLSGRVRA